MPPFPFTPPSPATPPISTPGEGVRAVARTNIANAVKLLIESLSVLKEVKSDEGDAIVKALKILGPVTPEVDDGVSKNALRSLLAGMEPVRPGAGGQPLAPGLRPPMPQPMAVAGMPFGASGGGGAPMPGGAL